MTIQELSSMMLSLSLYLNISSNQTVTIHHEMDSEAVTTLALCAVIRVTITDVTVSQQPEASRKFISETGMGRLIVSRS